MLIRNSSAFIAAVLPVKTALISGLANWTGAVLPTRDLARDLYRRWHRHNVGDLAAAITYRAFVALPPLLVFVSAVSALTAKLLDVDKPAQALVGSVSDALPRDVASVLETQLQEILDSPSGLALGFGLLGAIWTGALAVNTAVKWLNVIHDVEESRSLLHRWSLNVALTLAAGALLTVSFISFFAVQLFGPELASRIGLTSETAFVLGIAHWPLAFMLVVLAAGVLYKLGPDEVRSNRWVSVGAIGFGAVWLLGSFAFALYVSQFGNFNATYGLLGALLMLLTWFYITSIAFLMGAELDAACTLEVPAGAAAGGIEANAPGRKPSAV